MSKISGKPELLLSPNERALRFILRALIAANDPDSTDRTQAARLNIALSAISGRPKKRGPPEKDRDELLELMAFDYSVERYWKRRSDVTPTEIAKNLVKFHPATSGRAGSESVVADLVRKFALYGGELVDAYGFDGVEDFDSFFRPIVQALAAMECAGIGVDFSVLPPGADRFKEDKSGI